MIVPDYFGKIERTSDLSKTETSAPTLHLSATARDVAAKALELWSVEVIEEVLGSKAKSTLPEAIRTRELRARLPRYQLAMLEYIAEREQTTIGRVLSRELDDLANARAEELSSAIPGFGAALGWPELNETQQPS
jgi:hypothetical protein